MMHFPEFYNSLLEIEKGIVDLYKELLEDLKPQSILEVGSGWGIFTRTCMEFTDVNIITIDKIGGYGPREFAKNTEGFEHRINRIVEDSHVLLPRKELEWKEKFDFIFVDGDHTQGGASKDLSWVWGMLKPGGALMVDDVFHKANWQATPEDPNQAFNFGVTRALWGFIQAHESEMSGRSQISGRGHGIVVCYKK